MARFRSEAELARVVKTWLELQGWEVYQEVPCRSGRCDIVAVRYSVVWIVETKLSVGMAVIGQCLERLKEPASGVLAAVPMGRNAFTLGHIARSLNFGVLEVDKNNVFIEHCPPLRRIDTSSLRNKLRPEYKTFAAAGTSGTYWTPFKNLVDELQRNLREGPLKDASGGLAMKALNLYRDRAPAAQRRALTDYLKRGLIPGWTLEKRGRELWVVRSDPEVPNGVDP